MKAQDWASTKDSLPRRDSWQPIKLVTTKNRLFIQMKTNPLENLPSTIFDRDMLLLTNENRATAVKTPVGLNEDQRIELSNHPRRKTLWIYGTNSIVTFNPIASYYPKSIITSVILTLNGTILRKHSLSIATLSIARILPASKRSISMRACKYHRKQP
jgi:hypothetical protein